MTRLSTWISSVSGLVLIYGLLYFNFLSTPFITQTVKDEIIPVLPWYALITLGCYCLGWLGHGLLHFNDCQEAYEELLTQITESKDELRSKGVTID